MPPKLIVIDTQSVLDWLVFGNQACAGWAGALAGPGWRWIVTTTLRAEFDAVIAKGFGARWPVPFGAVEDAWLRYAHPQAVPARLGAGVRLHCTDPDDQQFIDLAIAARAHTLVSRDKALLRLARKAAERHDLRICRPEVWSADL